MLKKTLARYVVMMSGCFCLLAGCTQPQTRSQFAPPAENGEVTVKLSRPGNQLPGNHILAQAYINGYNVGYFIVDTGASVTIVNKTYADHMRLPKTNDRPMTLTGIGNRVTGEVYRIDALQIGEHDFGGHSVVAVDLDRFSRSKRVPVSGILGMDCLSRQPFTVDFENKVLILHDPATFRPPSDMEVYHFAYSPSGLVLMPALLDGKNKAWIMLDTGANASVSLPFSAMSHWPEMFYGKRNMQSQGSGVAGQVKTYESSIHSFTIFEKTVTDVRVTVEESIERPDAHHVVIGRVGNVILENFTFTIDYSKRLIWVRQVSRD